jgi:hypothetical protein
LLDPVELDTAAEPEVPDPEPEEDVARVLDAVAPEVPPIDAVAVDVAAVPDVAAVVPLLPLLPFAVELAEVVVAAAELAELPEVPVTPPEDAEVDRAPLDLLEVLAVPTAPEDPALPVAGPADEPVPELPATPVELLEEAPAPEVKVDEMPETEAPPVAAPDALAVEADEETAVVAFEPVDGPLDPRDPEDEARAAVLLPLVTEPGAVADLPQDIRRSEAIQSDNGRETRIQGLSPGLDGFGNGPVQTDNPTPGKALETRHRRRIGWPRSTQTRRRSRTPEIPGVGPGVEGRSKSNEHTLSQCPLPVGGATPDGGVGRPPRPGAADRDVRADRGRGSRRRGYRR